jgi:hypothetical protein
MGRLLGSLAIAALSLSWTGYAFQNYTQVDMMRAQLALMDDRPDNCPPWYALLLFKVRKNTDMFSFNCLLPAFDCGQYSPCNQYNGKCSCPPGYGGDDCLQPGTHQEIYITRCNYVVRRANLPSMRLFSRRKGSTNANRKSMRLRRRLGWNKLQCLSK